LVGAIYNTGLQLDAPFDIVILNVVTIFTNGNDSGSVRGSSALMKGFKNAFFGILAMEDLETGSPVAEKTVTEIEARGFESTKVGRDTSTIGGDSNDSLSTMEVKE
ncbi:hypothetical protein BG011_002047, partial [Mortierella polycephala]